MKVATSMIAVGVILLSAMRGGLTLSAEPNESKDCRLIINWDAANMWNPLLCYAQREHKLDAEGVKTALERIVDEHAQAKVDRIVHCGFVLPWGTVPPGLKSFDRLPEKTVESNLCKGLFDPDTETGIRQLEEAGYDFFRCFLSSHTKRVCSSWSGCA